jgi:hypothetical protein
MPMPHMICFRIIVIFLVFIEDLLGFFGNFPYSHGIFDNELYAPFLLLQSVHVQAEHEQHSSGRRDDSIPGRQAAPRVLAGQLRFVPVIVHAFLIGQPSGLIANRMMPHSNPLI